MRNINPFDPHPLAFFVHDKLGTLPKQVRSIWSTTRERGSPGIVYTRCIEPECQQLLTDHDKRRRGYTYFCNSCYNEFNRARVRKRAQHAKAVTDDATV